MKVAFTICSNNYLSRAKALMDSIQRHSPDYKLYIFLCDKKSPKVNYAAIDSAEVIEIDSIPIDNFDYMLACYNIVELNTAVKPFVFKYVYQALNASLAMFFDPDTYVFGSLSQIEDEFVGQAILLTPHILSPIEPDGICPTEPVFLQYGIYNLGFLATRRHQETMAMLDWWARRLAVQCFDKPSEGIFVDQLPMNYVPIFYSSVVVTKHPGINAAPWNLFERKIEKTDGVFRVNSAKPLLMYHYSNCAIDKPEVLSTFHQRTTFATNPELLELYNPYKAEVSANARLGLVNVNCVYMLQPKQRRDAWKKKIKNAIKRVIP